MRKIFILGLMMLSTILIGCDSTSTINVEDNNETIIISSDFEDNLVELNDYLYYDKTTDIVYLWNGYRSGNLVTMPSPYYASNGLPYKYNPKTGNLYMIEQEEQK